MISIKQEALGNNTLCKQELGLNEERAKCSIQEKIKGSGGSPPCKHGQRCTFMKGGVCKFDHTKYPMFKTKKQCFYGKLCGIPGCVFKHKRDEKFSYSKDSHSIISQEVRHFDNNSIYSIFASAQENHATSVAFTSATFPTHFPSPSVDQLMINSKIPSA